MKQSKYSDAQIMSILKQAEGGVPVTELCREHGMSNASFYKWRSKFGGMRCTSDYALARSRVDASLISRMKVLEEKNKRLKKMYAEKSMQADLLKESLGRKWWGHGAFMESYAANKQSVVDAAIEGNPFAKATINLICENGHWEGTATDLLRVLKTQYPLLADDPQCFPHRPNKVSSELRRVRPLLGSPDVSMKFERRRPRGVRTIVLK